MTLFSLYVPAAVGGIFHPEFAVGGQLNANAIGLVSILQRDSRKAAHEHADQYERTLGALAFWYAAQLAHSAIFAKGRFFTAERSGPSLFASIIFLPGMEWRQRGASFVIGVLKARLRFFDNASGPEYTNAGLAIDSSGRILFPVSSAGSMIIVRYTENGALDTSFNGTGFVSSTVGASTGSHGVAVEAAGRVLVSGRTTCPGPRCNWTVLTAGRDRRAWKSAGTTTTVPRTRHLAGARDFTTFL